jgi:DNA-binding transcriptional ArsR family regulator
MRKKSNGKGPNEELASGLLIALKHPLRRRIIVALAGQPASAKMLAQAFHIPLSNVSYHLCKVLFEECDLVKVIERNARRGAEEKVFVLNPEAFLGAIDWATIPEPMRSGIRGIALHSFWDAAIAAIEAESQVPKDASVYMYRPLSVDEEGQREIGVAIEEFTGRVKAVEDRCSGLNPRALLHLILSTAVFEAAPLSEARDG